MAYIGNTVQTQGFAPAVDYFNGDGTTVTFTLSRPVASVAQLTAVIDNVIQNPSSAFTVSGNAITFTSAPLSGTNNIWVEYTSLVTTYAAISQDPSVIGDITATGGYLAEGDFGNSYIDGTIVDYVTGNARITTGPIDDMTFYHGGTASRSEMMRLSYAGNSYIVGNLGVGTTSPSYALDVRSTAAPAIRLSRSGTAGQIASVVFEDGTATLGTGNTTRIASDSGAMSFSTGGTSGAVTGGTERMRISADGYVTMPYQPAFKASASANASVSNAVLPFNTTTSSYGGFNQGGFFNTSTYRFTAPVAGVYQFNMTLSVYNTGSGSYPYIRKNGTLYIGVDGFASGGVWVGKTICICLSLAVNDYVDCYWEGTATYSIEGGTWASFSGCLLG